MKTKFAILLLCSLVFLNTGSRAASPTNVQVVLSPHYQAQDRSRVFDMLVRLVREAPLGTRFTLYDGWAKETITEVCLPTSLRVDNPDAVLKHKDVRVGLARVHLWLHPTGESSSDSALAGKAFIDLPGALDLVSTAPATAPTSIVVVGSPLYHSTNEPAFSFLPDLFPSDGNLFADVGSSLFSILDRRQRLRNCRIYLWHFNEGWFNSDLHRDRVARWWNLFVSYQQAVLAGIGGDQKTVLKEVFNPEAPAVRRDSLDPALAKVEMLAILRPQPPVRRMTNELGQATFRVEDVPANQPVSVRAEREVLRDLNATPDNLTAAGIIWDLEGVDLDLYCWARPEAAPLFFGNALTPEGRYLRDYRDRNDRLDYEKVVLNPAPQAVGSLEIAVNIYSGHSRVPVTGKVFVRHEGRTYAGTFSLAAREGNRGGDRDQRDGSPFWTKILVEKLEPVGQETTGR